MFTWSVINVVWLIVKVAGIVSGNCVPVDSFCESMDLYCFVVTIPDSKKVRFVPYNTNPDSFRIVDHKSLMFSKDSFCGFVSLTDFQKIQPVFTNPTNPYES